MPYQVLIAVLSRPAVESLLAESAPINRGGYVSQRKAELRELPVPACGAAERQRLIELVDELHQTATAARQLSEIDHIRSAAERRVWVTSRVEEIVADAFGLTGADLEVLAP